MPEVLPFRYTMIPFYITQFICTQQIFGNHIPKFNIEKSFFIGLVRGDGISENWNGGVWPSFFAGFKWRASSGWTSGCHNLEIFDCVTTVTPQRLPSHYWLCLLRLGRDKFQTLLTHGEVGSVLIFILLNDRFKKINEN